jgi:glycerol-3-phosphate acyltransferase PlsY
MVCMLIPTFLVFIDKLNFLYLFDGSLLFPQPLVISWNIRISLFVLTFINALIVIVRHSTNIKQLIKHEERKIF